MAELGLKQQYSVLFSFSSSGRACRCSTWYPLALDTLGWLSLTHMWCRGPFPPHGFSTWLPWLFSQHGLAELDFVRGDWILEVPTVEAARLPEGLCLELAPCCLHQKHVSRPVQIQAESTVGVWALAKVVYWGHQGTLHHVNQVLFWRGKRKKDFSVCFYCLILLAYSFYNAVV